ncbi:Inner membrane ABC transporter permease protein YdcV [Roseovarius sp. EC-HK134]|jgi:spermidine/putrescine transport system permease protein|uniref:Inner membrane ABC transporter permease protein YdcV n=1 Tax=Roseovarius mucosus TaxID=215743 RepID=A0A1V0RTS1_9RHOB|nr:MULTISPECIES: ABC transporter permease [Roseovarius]ARE85086.1 inner membrane ABC transporter permease protein YdcV [Roseovarius mucosus]AWZ21167.1 Spermidine Putrescine ABC transporter permease component potC [Roseovarius sp. AK1035]EDM33050.1 spermidine/putrescine ABC transporter, permease protein [Roseovarius sp. TM1035]MBW4974382.1 ABC transporter permease [Roseovarius mucosus]VVT22823.1 Inner membrane ABC transporter permease protein YdcV [Roseovarius sp. EC-SD190]
MSSYIKRPNRALQLYAVLFLIVLYVPVLFIPLFSFNDSIYVRFPLQGFTLQWYGELWTREPVWNALWNSVKVGLVVSVISTVLGVMAARAITRTRMRGKGALVTFIMMPLVIPGIIFGVALLVLLSRMGVPLSLYTVGLGHLIICLPFAVATLLPRFEGFDPSMEEASADLGENGWWTFWRVTFPMVLPGIVASLLLTFTISFDEFIMAFFLTGTDPTLPMYIWGQLRFPKEFPSVLAMAALILFVSFALVFVAQWIGRKGLEDQE